ncbi:MAG: thioredoxin family protein [Bacteriovoracaceae bacterium]|nr:thioredoxin family protein [Bacteriovoracaceae bacterium]
MKLRLFSLLFILNTFFAFAYASQGDELVDMGIQNLNIEGKSYVAVSLKNQAGWHTYWKNPGDAGLPTKITFFDEQKNPILIKELEWPLPHKYLEEGGLLTFGYADLHTFFFEITEDIRTKYQNKNMTVQGQWLVCKDICVPGKGEIKVQLVDKELLVKQKTELEVSTSDLVSAFNKIPKLIEKPANFELYLMKSLEGNNLLLHYTLKNVTLSQYDTSMNLLTPFPAVPFGYKHEKVLYDADEKTLYGVINVDWDGQLQEPEIPFPANGVFTKPIMAKFLINLPGSKNVNYIEHSFTDFSLVGQETLDNFLKTLSEVIPGSHAENNDAKSIWTYLLFALLGGFILNLMPCVLPVISLKLFGLIKHQQMPRAKVLKHNLSYTFGTIATFWLMAIIVMLIKSSGDEIGWGFQLQSPIFVFVMVLFLFILSLNLFGLFEFKTPGGNSLGNLKLQEGFIGDFMAGVLATVLSTPCSAPFLGTALGFAFTTTSTNIFLIFTFVGIGLSLPFLITGAFPQLISFLPRPGAWMDTLKKFLGLTMLITVAWLYDVLLSLVDAPFFNLQLNVLFIFVFSAFYFPKYFKKNSILRIILILIPLVLTTLFFSSYFKTGNTSDKKTTEQKAHWQNWSEQAMLAQPGNVFVDFTAKWCLTCKVNKKLVLDTQAFLEFAQKESITLMQADWTKRDDNITQFLNKHKLAGVPAYFLKTADGNVFFLGETISIAKIQEKL